MAIVPVGLKQDRANYEALRGPGSNLTGISSPVEQAIRKCWSNSGLLLHRRRDIAVRRQTDLVAFHVGHETAVDVVVVAFVLGRQLRIRALGSKSTK
jgi:hypothetical protein